MGDNVRKAGPSQALDEVPTNAQRQQRTANQARARGNENESIVQVSSERNANPRHCPRLASTGVTRVVLLSVARSSRADRCRRPQRGDMDGACSLQPVPVIGWRQLSASVLHQLQQCAIALLKQSSVI